MELSSIFSTLRHRIDRVQITRRAGRRGGLGAPYPRGCHLAGPGGPCLRMLYPNPPAAVGRRIPQIVDLENGDAGQPRKLDVPKHLVLPLHNPARRWPGQILVGRIDRREQRDVLARAPLGKARRRASSPPQRSAEEADCSEKSRRQRESIANAGGVASRADRRAWLRQ